MMKTIPKVPNVTSLKPIPSRRFHTLHLVNDIFTIQNNGTSVVSFRNKYDAFHLGKMLESHFDMTHEWPIVNFEDSILYKQTKVSRLKYLRMKSWDEDKLREFCIKNNFSMLDIFSFQNDYRLVGRSIFWEVPPDYYVSMLNEKFEES